MNLNVFPCHWINPKPSGLSALPTSSAVALPKAGTAVLASLERLPNPLALPKAFQNQTSFAFGFFNAPQLTKASFRRCVALKKPLICMRGFVANIGASLEEFAGDIRAILDAKLKNR